MRLLLNLEFLIKTMFKIIPNLVLIHSYPSLFFFTSLPLVLHDCYNMNTQPNHLCHQLLHAQLKWNNKSKEVLLISILICKTNHVLHRCWGHWFNWPWNNLQLAHLQAHHFVKDCIVSYFNYYLTTSSPTPVIWAYINVYDIIQC
jgi:hypothetical protein